MTSLLRNHGFRSVAKELVLTFVFFQLIVAVSGAENPVAIVVSGSMEPAVYRGDIVFMYNDKSTPFSVGEIVTFGSHDDTDGEKTILHRIVHTNGTHVQTKGDNNPVSDAYFLYDDALPVERLTGRVWLTVPYIARPFTWIIEQKPLLYLLIASNILYVTLLKPQTP